MEPKKISYIQLTDSARQLAAMRAAMLRLTLSDYMSQLVQADAKSSGLADLVQAETDKGVDHD